MHTLNSRSKRIAAASLAAALALGAILFARRPSAAPPPPPSAMNRPSALRTPALTGNHEQSVSHAVPITPTRAHANDAPRGSVDSPLEIAPAPPVDPANYLPNAPRDPITPPVIYAEAELAPGSVPTSAPLTPPEVVVPSPVPIDPASVRSAPLTPPVVDVDDPHGAP